MQHLPPVETGQPRGSKEEVNITRISFCAVDVSLVGAFVMLTKIEKAVLKLGQEENRGAAQNQSIKWRERSRILSIL